MANPLEYVADLLKDVRFEPGESFFWSPQTRTVTYNEVKLGTVNGDLALLHESCHALLNHTNYRTDLELLMMEVAAWEKAESLAKDAGIPVDHDHIQDCLDTYRDWLHQRSTCPSCGTVSLQVSPKIYRCHNCNNSWQVSVSRFCRPYRKALAAQER